MNAKICRNCHERKPEDDFYIYSSSQKRMPICKKCHLIKCNQRKPRPKHISGNDSEFRAIQHMRKLGIYAAPGKSSEHHFLDVIAWGCVRVEVKPVTRMFDRQDVWRISFSRNQCEKGLVADVIVVMIPAQSDYHYYVLPANHAFFRDTNGKLIPEMLINRRVLPGSVLHQHRDNWQLIEKIRQEIIDDLKAGKNTIAPVEHVELPPEKHHNSTQLPLF